MNKSKERALEILNLYLSGISQFDFVKSVVLVGSLSDGTYMGNAGSDIDLINIVDADQLATARQYIFNYINEILEKTQHDIRISKTVYQFADLFHPYRYNFVLSQENKDYVERPIEILRMKDTGKTIYGEDIISFIDYPTKDDVIKGHELSAQLTQILAKQQPEWYSGYLKMCENPTTGILVQIVITTAMSVYFFITGKNCSSKYRILSCILQDIPEFEYLSLLALCHKWRYHNKDITQDELKQMEDQYQALFIKRKRYF